MKKNPRIEQSFLRWVFTNHYGWRHIFKIGHNPILMMFVNLCIYLNWFSNAGKFKPGDKVRYNFFARVMIPGIEEIKGEEKATYTFLRYYTTSKENGEYLKPNGEEDSCAVFWLSKI